MSSNEGFIKKLLYKQLLHYNVKIRVFINVLEICLILMLKLGIYLMVP